MKTVKRIAALFALMFTAAAWAVDAPTPVALWNGDFKETTKGSYTLSDNGNTVAADGSSITISTAKGVTFERSSALANNIGMTVIYKFDNLVVGSAIKTIGTASAGGGNADRVGVNVQISGQTSGIWANTTTYNDGANQTTISTVDTDGQVALVYGPSVANNTGTFLYLKNGSADYTLAYSCGGLKGGNDTVQAMTVGGTRNNGGTFPAASGMVIKAVALFDQALTQAQIAEYVFPKKSVPAVEPLMLLNVHKDSPVDGWYNHTQPDGPTIPKSGTITTNDISFAAGNNGNFFPGNWTRVSSNFTSGDYADVFGQSHTDLIDEIKASLGLPEGFAFTEDVYKTGLMNGGTSGHTATISGLSAEAKYVIYAGFGLVKDVTQCQGFKIQSSGYTSVESREYVTTIAGVGTSVATSYQTFDENTTIRPGAQGLMVVRLKNVIPTAQGAVSFILDGERAGINFLAVAKVNEIEEPEETETINYTATGFVTKTYQQTGWNTTIDEILQYGTLTPTMSGGYMNPKPVTGAAQFITKTTEGSDAVLSMQMQVVNDGHLKVVEIYLKDSDNGVLIKATRAGHTTGAALGTNQTSFGDQVAENANANGYGVASVALSITKPVNKSVKGTIGEVTTEHSEDYTSNTITAKVTIENEGEYKGEAVLVYVLNGTTNEVAVAEGQTTLTINGLEQEKVYRGTLALGQKLEGGTVVVIEGIEVPVALYQGEQKFVWNDKSIVLKTASTISDGAGCTIKPVCNDPDYVDLCDSEYIVSLSASESVDADDESLEGVQGGVRIAKVDDALELQIIDNGQWTNLADATVDTSYTLTVKFHYNKGEGDEEGATSVTYTLDSTTKEATNKTDKLKVTEVFIADGTVLPNDLTGLFQLDKAVVADVEIVIDHDESAEIDAKNLDAAQAIADKMVVAISEEVAKVVSAETYRGYFKVVAKQGTDGKFHAVVEFAPGVQEAIEDDIEEAMEKVVSGFSSGSAEIAAKPGLYYGVKRGDDLNNLNIEETTLATSEKVTITITKPDTSKSHFYRIIVSPTPATK